MFKDGKTHIHPGIAVQVDTGYKGIKKYRPNSEVPYKRSKKATHQGTAKTQLLNLQQQNDYRTCDTGA